MNSPDEFLEHFRKNINDFIDDEPFEPYGEWENLQLEQQETALWNSDNQVGAMIKINIKGFLSEYDGNDGVVVCSESADDLP